jgi:hypothetical protein
VQTLLVAYSAKCMIKTAEAIPSGETFKHAPLAIERCVAIRVPMLDLKSKSNLTLLRFLRSRFPVHIADWVVRICSHCELG